MTGGLLQLVALGYEDMYLTYKPQITFFKMVYRRHTNFSSEGIFQYFTTVPNFGKKVTCTISKNGDLMGKTYLIFKLPQIKQLSESDTLTKFAWVRRLGYSLIKYIEIEINGHVIDRHYGVWMNIWAELTGMFTGEHARGHKIMIGDTIDNYSFTTTKKSLLLYIPLNFWFCRGSGLAIPLICLQCSDVKINMELNDVEHCYIIAPSHYIICRDALASGFLPYEYIEQNINGDIRAGLFVSYDVLTSKLYYLKLTNDTFIGYPVTTYPSTPEEIALLEAEPNYASYEIVGKTSHYFIQPDFNTISHRHSYQQIKNITINNCYLLVNYFYLDNDERVRIAQSKHEYIIEQSFYTSDVVIDNINNLPRIYVDQPSKLIVWTTQMKYNKDNKDYFNYSDSYQRKYDTSEYTDLDVGDVTGNNIVINETIQINGTERISKRDSDYFNYIQPLQFLKAPLQTGINMLSLSLYPLLTQPSGTCNMSQLEDILALLQLNTKINSTNKAYFSTYCLCYNVLRIASGLAGLVFVR